MFKRRYDGILGKIQDILLETSSLSSYPFFQKLVTLLDSWNPQESLTGARCSFCGISIFECRKTIAGPGVIVCDTCVSLMVHIIRDEVDPNFMRE